MWRAKELQAFLVFISLNIKMQCRHTCKWRASKNVLRKEFRLDWEDSRYATLKQIGFNIFHCACTPADSDFPLDSKSFPTILKDDQNTFEALWQYPGSEMSAALLQIKTTRSIVYFAHSDAMLNSFAKLFSRVHKRLLTVLRDTKDQPRIFTLTYKDKWELIPC